MTPRQAASIGYGRPAIIIGAIAAGAGLVGFLVGLSEPVEPIRAKASPNRSLARSAPAAPRYEVIDGTAFGPNAGWSSQFTTLKQDRPELFAPVVRTAAMKQEALRDRLRTRAFDGAPPVIPHPVEQQSAANCLVCHGAGLKLGDKIATSICHPPYANCLQCHVEQVSAISVAGDVAPAPLPVNNFAGVLRSGPGSRAMLGAPPTIPHTLQLRGDCLSCHGLVARPGLRTTHPWLQNCQQCHVADGSAERPRVAESTSSEAQPR